MPSMVTLAKARLGTPNLDVLSFAFVALNGDARQAAEGIGHVGVGQAANHFRGQYLHDVIGRELTVDGFGFSGGTLGSNQHFEILGLDLKLGIYGGNLPANDSDLLGEVFEPT